MKHLSHMQYVKAAIKKVSWMYRKEIYIYLVEYSYKLLNTKNERDVRNTVSAKISIDMSATRDWREKFRMDFIVSSSNIPSNLLKYYFSE